jgi:hypothetical protein
MQLRVFRFHVTSAKFEGMTSLVTVIQLEYTLPISRD